MGLISFLKNKFSGTKSVVKAKYVLGLEKSRYQFSGQLNRLSGKHKHVTESYFLDLEDILIEADISTKLIKEIILATKQEVQTNGITDTNQINEVVVDKMFIGYAQSGKDITNEIVFIKERPTVILVVGVNGVGKTTTIAKLAHRYKNLGKKVLLVAGDTFRAGAQEQLQIWAKRLNVDIEIGKPEEDPSSVTFRALGRAKEEKHDLVIVDTAGRLQTKVNLMAELSKIRRIISREFNGAPDEVFLIIDGTTGQNGVLQAKAFAEATGLTGVIITKMDGTSKGGIILSIRDQIGVPVRFIGLGEKLDDLMEFDLEQYLYGLCLGDSR